MDLRNGSNLIPIVILMNSGSPSSGAGRPGSANSTAPIGNSKRPKFWKLVFYIEEIPVMDFKGITWAGNVYQKFEAMCLEVDEVMYEDTVKYVENQAQKVGASVKKFYSEVVHDLLPPSCVDPVKLSAGDLSLNPYTFTDFNKKPKPYILDSNIDFKDRENEDESISKRSSQVLVQTVRSELCSTKSKKIGIKRISQNGRPSKISRPVSQISSSEIVNKNTRVFDVPVESSASDKLMSVESVRQKEGDSECTSSSSGVLNEFIDTSKNNTSFCQIGSSIRSNACDVDSVGKKVMTSDEGTTKMKDGSISQLSSNISGVVSQDTEVKLSDEDNFDMEVIENEEFADPRVEMSENFNLEETCVLVEGDNIHFSPEGTRKHKSYKVYSRLLRTVWLAI